MRFALTCSVCLGLAGLASAQTLDNPMYQWWSAWQEGSTITLKTETSIGGKVENVVQTTQTLKKLSAEKAVVETTTVIQSNEQTIKAGPFPVDILARVPKIDVDPKAAERPAEETKIKVTNGKETLTINGKPIPCEWTQTEDGSGSVVKAWMSNDVPGRVVKNVASDKASNSSTTTVLVEIKATRK